MGLTPEQVGGHDERRRKMGRLPFARLFWILGLVFDQGLGELDKVAA
jgi:hypothetical protein